MKTEYKVLMCAYACLQDPDTRFGNGGEVFLGWAMADQASKHGQVFVLTHSGNRQAIEKKMSDVKNQNLFFWYIALPKYLEFLEKMGGGVQLCAYLWQIKAYFVGKKLHKKYHFTMFHHVTYANDWMASFIGALLPVPYIRGPGGGAHVVPKEFVKEYSFGGRLAQKIRTAGQWIFRHDPFFIMGQNKAKAILVCNQEAFDAMPHRWQKKAYFFPVNGISKEDLEFIASKKNTNNDFLICTAGKLIRIKAFDLAIKAFKDFNVKVPDSKLVIAGDGPELKNLEKLAQDLGLKDKVKFEGWVNHQTLLEIMSGSDVFLFTSLRDGGGAVVVEAMAQAKPVVCFDIAGPGFHITSEYGIKVTPVSPKQSALDLAEALKKLYDNKELRIALGQAARNRAQDYYVWDKLGDHLQGIYTKALQDGE